MLPFGYNPDLVLFPSAAWKGQQTSKKVAPHQMWWAVLSNDRRGNALTQPNVRIARTQPTRTNTPPITRAIQKKAPRPATPQSIPDVSHAFPPKIEPQYIPCQITHQTQEVLAPTAIAAAAREDVETTTVMEIATVKIVAMVEVVAAKDVVAARIVAEAAAPDAARHNQPS